MPGVLFDAGADPNEDAMLSGRMTIWQAFLRECYYREANGPGELRSAALLFPRYGADKACKDAITLSGSSYAPIGNLKW